MVIERGEREVVWGVCGEYREVGEKRELWDGVRE